MTLRGTSAALLAGRLVLTDRNLRLTPAWSSSEALLPGGQGERLVIPLEQVRAARREHVWLLVRRLRLTLEDGRELALGATRGDLDEIEGHLRARLG